MNNSVMREIYKIKIYIWKNISTRIQWPKSIQDIWATQLNRTFWLSKLREITKLPYSHISWKYSISGEKNTYLNSVVVLFLETYFTESNNAFVILKNTYILPSIWVFLVKIRQLKDWDFGSKVLA